MWKSVVAGKPMRRACASAAQPSGPSVTTCNCDFGCPCQFNSLPTHGDCRAAVAMRIDEGHFGDVSLDGVKWVTLLAWPGPIHEGNGEALIIVDEGASAAQRQGVLAILSGQETEPGATIFQVFSTTFANVHEPRFLPVVFEADLEARKGHFSVDGVVEAEASPIVNPMTGAEHRVRVTLPTGFEYTEAEYASAAAKAADPIPLDYSGSHAHFTTIHMTPQGVVR